MHSRARFLTMSISPPPPFGNYNSQMTESLSLRVSDDFRRAHLYNEPMDIMFKFMEVHVGLDNGCRTGEWLWI